MKKKLNAEQIRMRRVRWVRSVAILSIGVLAVAPFASSQPKAPTTAASNGANQEIVTDGIGAKGCLKLSVNKTAVIRTSVPAKRLSVGSPDIADVNAIGPNSILVTAKKMGTTQIIIWDDADRSQVIDVTVDFDLQALQDQLKTMFPGSKIEVSALNGSIILRGRVPDLQAAEQAVAVAAPYSQKVLNFLEVSGGQQVMLQVRFAEVSRGAISNLGFRGYLSDGKAQAGIFNGPGASPIGAVATGKEATVDPTVNVLAAGEIGNVAFEAFLSAMKTNNLLRVLAEPNLVAISGQEASFLAGGEIPVPVPQSSGSGTTITIEYKQFGVRLSFVPVVLGDGRVRLKCSPEVSELDYSNAVTLSGTQVPALNKRNVTTTVELQDGQTFAIAGLLNDRVQATRASTPYLGELPVLGALFRSVRYERKETELLVLVTPRVVAPMNPDQVPTLPGEHWRHPSENELFWMQDLGGEQKLPAGRAGRGGRGARIATTAPAADAEPARFHGTYGFVPVTQTATIAPDPAESVEPSGESLSQ